LVIALAVLPLAIALSVLLPLVIGHIVPHSTLTVDQAHPNLKAATMCDLISVAMRGK
jgi:hypothetical protein